MALPYPYPKEQILREVLGRAISFTTIASRRRIHSNLSSPNSKTSPGKKSIT
jgi:hypothetical protein